MTVTTLDPIPPSPVATAPTAAPAGPDVALFDACIDACIDCARACVRAADAGLARASVPGAVAPCVRRNDDCADVCQATTHLLARGPHIDPAIVRYALRAMIDVARHCAAVGDGHGDGHDGCRSGAEACRRCADACHVLLDALA